MKPCDVALTQEPCTAKETIKVLKEVGGELIYSRFTSNPRTCILIEKGFQILPLMHHSSTDFTAVKIQHEVVVGRGRLFSDGSIFRIMTLYRYLYGKWGSW